MRLKQNSSSHWSNYWQGGQLTSLPQDFKENYNGAIHAEWENCFKRLSNNSSMLDMCAGNCAISLLAATFAKQNKLNINLTAIDAANVTKASILAKYPQQRENLSKIKLIANCQVEDISLESNQFDLITSQYGIEYCDWDLAAKQVSRLLKTSGEFSIISHTGSTEIMKYMQGEKTDYQLLYEIGLFKYLGRYVKNKMSYKALLIELQRIKPKIVIQYNNNSSQLLRSILSLFDHISNMNKATLDAKRQELQKFCEQHKFAFSRLQDLLRVIQSIVEYPDWYTVFVTHGLELVQEKAVIQNNNINTGTLLRFIKK